MTYAAGGLIQASDYNTLAWGTSSGGTYTTSPMNLAVVHGVGTGRYGYGQSTSSYTQLSAAATVTATQWTGLFGGITASANHSGASLASLPSSVTAGSVITYLAATGTAITNIGNAVGNVSGATTDGSPTVYTGPSSWQTSTTATHTVTFADANSARYFFNAGGKIKLSFSISGAGSSRNAEWSDTASQSGTIIYGYLNTTKSGGAGTPNVLLNSNNGGYWNTTTGGVVHFRQYSDSSPYTANYIQVTATWSGTTANGGYPTITFTTLWADDQSNPFQEAVTQAASTSLVISYPPTTFLTNTWGTPTVSGSATGS